MRKCSDCQTAIAAAHEVDDAFHGVDALLVPQPLKRALTRLCLALEYMHEEGKPDMKYLEIMDLIKEGEENGRTTRANDEVLQIRRVSGVLPGNVRGTLSPQAQARKAMRERAKARKTQEGTLGSCQTQGNA